VQTLQQGEGWGGGQRSCVSRINKTFGRFSAQLHGKRTQAHKRTSMKLLAALPALPTSLGPWEIGLILYCLWRAYAYFFPAPVAPSNIAKPVGAAAFAAARAAARADQLVVVDFYATWCGPCVALAPFLETLQEAHKATLFLKVQEDESPDVIAAENITCYPTLRFYLAGKCVKEMRGASPAALKEAVEQLEAAAAKGEAVPEVHLAAPGGAGGGGGCTVF
jgi:thiol-disulfide isomerase/thioredoxin